MKNIVFLILFSLWIQPVFSQSGFDSDYAFQQSGSFVQDKNFYIFTLFDQVSTVNKLLKEDPQLLALLNKIKEQNDKPVEHCQLDINCMLDPFLFTEAEQEELTKIILKLYDKDPTLKNLIQNHIKPSGTFIKYAQLNDKEMLSKIIKEAFAGIQLIVDTYGKGKKGRYPKIDSVSYDVNGRFYQRVLRSVCFSVVDDFDTMELFFQPSLQLALTLMDINYRNEAGRHEPMAQQENKKAFEYIPTIDWGKYKYACILQPGHGPEKEGIALSPLGKMRIKLVAKRYHEGWAPLIILSGGYVHPNQTPYAEATEMKKALIDQYGIPERAIIIEPHARHTTTNFRNAARLMFKYGIPTDKLSVCTTTFDQLIYITDPKWKFEARNMKELGYLPYQLFEKVSRNDVEFKPVITSLHADPLDPLDP